jgi:acyl-CoA synthetase (AMP-forming)/AMP-acid ligase II
LADKLAAFKIPLQIYFSDSILPRLASGKFDKPLLRKEFSSKFKKTL